MATHSTPNSRSAAVTGAGGGLGREVAVQLARVFGIARNDKDIVEVEAASADANGQHRGSSAQRGTGADRRHRHQGARQKQFNVRYRSGSVRDLLPLL